MYGQGSMGPMLVNRAIYGYMNFGEMNYLIL